MVWSRGDTPVGPIDVVSVHGPVSKRYGFIYVDRNDDGTGTWRYRKKSSSYYQQVIASNGARLDDDRCWASGLTPDAQLAVGQEREGQGWLGTIGRLLRANNNECWPAISRAGRSY